MKGRGKEKPPAAAAERCASALLLFCIGGMLFLGVARADSSSPRNRLEEGTIAVLWGIETSRPEALEGGSGFIVGKGDYVVTNWHVVAKPTEVDGYILWVDEGGGKVKAQVVGQEQQKDVAILKLERVLHRPPVVFAPKGQVQKNQKVEILGFKFPKAATGNVKWEPVKISNRTLSTPEEDQDTTSHHYQIDAPSSVRDSGGAVFNEDGQMVGIIVAAGPEGKVYALPVDELLPELDKLGISPESSQPSGTNSATQGWQGTSATLLIGGGVVVLTLLSLSFIFTRRRQMTVQAAAPRNRVLSSLSSPSQPLEARPSADMKSNPCLVGVAGYFTGSVFELEGKVVTIGRDPQDCQIVFPPDLTIIGRKHCALHLDREDRSFLLEHCGSQNGTFLASGEKIRAEEPCRLRSGDKFYLSDPQTMFEVRWE